jgi:hypothetical protein
MIEPRTKHEKIFKEKAIAFVKKNPVDDIEPEFIALLYGILYNKKIKGLNIKRDKNDIKYKDVEYNYGENNIVIDHEWEEK